MLKLKNIKKSYGTLDVIKSTNLDFIQGEFVTLLGPNGVGKSTLLNIMAGMEFPDEGSVLYKESDLFGFSFAHTEEIAFVHELINYDLSIPFSEFMEILSQQSSSWNQEYFNLLVNFIDFEIDKNFNSYSRGQKMQLALIASLATSPKVILLDEITSVLDTRARKFFLDELKKFVVSGGSVIITSNIVNELDYYSDRVIIINNGVVKLDEKRSNIDTSFIKIRKTLDNEDFIFNDHRCTWSGINSDGSSSYIISKDVADEYELSAELKDRRATNLEDIFLYYFKK